jgi:hypothetical protein
MGRGASNRPGVTEEKAGDVLTWALLEKHLLACG